MKLPNWISSVSAVFVLASCALLQSPGERAHNLALASGFKSVALPEEGLLAFIRAVEEKPNPRLTIYIESDGAPWLSRNLPPTDPTPLRPLVLRLALADPSPGVAYLGRPCQYLLPADLAKCDPLLWRRGRYGEMALSNIAAAIERLKHQYGSRTINLVGYSGGGAIASLVAAGRSDVGCLVTIAAPLDTEAWTSAIGVSPLSASLNPADYAARLHATAQTHFQGGHDQRVPPVTARRFLQQVPTTAVVHVPEFDHECCWEEAWPTLYRKSCLAD